MSVFGKNRALRAHMNRVKKRWYSWYKGNNRYICAFNHIDYS